MAPHCADTVPTLSIHVDSNKIAQVVRNLVSNALKFTPKGGTVDVSICEVEMLRRDPVTGRDVAQKMLQISVTDSGAGISEVSCFLLLLSCVILIAMDYV